jgi:hypothetical protein
MFIDSIPAISAITINKTIFTFFFNILLPLPIVNYIYNQVFFSFSLSPIVFLIILFICEVLCGV